MGVVVIVLLALFSPSTIERGKLVGVASAVEISQLLLLLLLIKIDNIIVVADNKYRNKKLFPWGNNIDWYSATSNNHIKISIEIVGPVNFEITDFLPQKMESHLLL